MKTNKLIPLALLFLIGNKVFPIARQTEELIIRNYSSKTIIIEREYWDTSDTIPGLPGMWWQTIDGLRVNIFDAGYDLKELRRKPRNANPRSTLIEIAPVTPQLREIPFMVKMRSIFKSLRITTEDGKLIIDLDNIEEHIISFPEPEGSPYHRLDIYDSDL